MAFVLRVVGSSGKQSPYWYASFSVPVPGGKMKRVVKSTKLRLKKDAKSLAFDWEKQAHAAAAGKIAARQAYDVIGELMETITGEAVERYTAEGWLTEWLEQKETAAKGKTAIRYRLPIMRFLEFIGPGAARPLESVTATMIREFRDGERQKGKSASTCNMDLKILRMPFAAAMRAGLLARNPAVGVDRLPDDSERKTPFTLDQLQALLRVAKGEWRGLILVGLYTGARLGDCARLRWGNVDIVEGVIKYVPQKTNRGSKRGKETIVPIHAALKAYLLDMTSTDDPQAFVFPWAGTARVDGKNGLSIGFGRLMTKAGITPPVVRARGEAKDGKKSQGREGRALSFHSLRHTMTTMMESAGVPVETRSAFTGHTSIKMAMHYCHTEIPTLRDAVDKLPEIKIT